MAHRGTETGKRGCILSEDPNDEEVMNSVMLREKLRRMVLALTKLDWRRYKAVPPVQPAGAATADTHQHELKTWPQFFAKILDGSKPFEIRKDDRGFKVGDELLLREWNPQTGEYTGRELSRVVTYLYPADGYGDGLTHGYCVMGIAQPTSGKQEQWTAHGIKIHIGENRSLNVGNDYVASELVKAHESSITAERERSKASELEQLAREYAGKLCYEFKEHGVNAIDHNYETILDFGHIAAYGSDPSDVEKECQPLVDALEKCIATLDDSRIGTVDYMEGSRIYNDFNQAVKQAKATLAQWKEGQ